MVMTPSRVAAFNNSCPITVSHNISNPTPSEPIEIISSDEGENENRENENGDKPADYGNWRTSGWQCNQLQNGQRAKSVNQGASSSRPLRGVRLHSRGGSSFSRGDSFRARGESYLRARSKIQHGPPRGHSESHNVPPRSRGRGYARRSFPPRGTSLRPPFEPRWDAPDEAAWNQNESDFDADWTSYIDKHGSNSNDFTGQYHHRGGGNRGPHQFNRGNDRSYLNNESEQWGDNEPDQRGDHLGYETGQWGHESDQWRRGNPPTQNSRGNSWAQTKPNSLMPKRSNSRGVTMSHSSMTHSSGYNLGTQTNAWKPQKKPRLDRGRI